MALSETCNIYSNRLKTDSRFTFYAEYIHWFLIAAVPFAFAWSFLEKRKYFKTNILGGRPALYRVVNLLDGGVRDRWGTSFILGAMISLVYNVAIRNLLSNTFPVWAKVLFIYAQALEATVLTLPFFVCLSTRFRLLGGVIGVFYALGWSVLSMYDFVVPIICLVEANNTNSSATQNDETVKSIRKELVDDTILLQVMTDIPMYICFICIVGKFITRIYDCIKKGEYTRQDKDELSVTNSEIYIKYLMDPAGTKATQSIRKKYLQRITHNIPGFTYSSPIFSTAFMMAIVLYQIILVEHLLLDILQKNVRIYSQRFSLEQYLEKYRIASILQGCSVASGIATGIYGCSMIYSLLMTYKRHMLKLYKGEREFLPESIEQVKAETHLIRSTQYMGNQIIGMIFGTITCFFCLFVPLTLLCLVFRLVEVNNNVPQLLQQFQILVYPVSVFLIFRFQIIIVGKFFLQERLNPTDQQRPLAIDNRKAHDLFKFFMLFVNLSTGFIVFLRRIFSYIFLGIFLVPRMDRSLFPKGFESDDKCHMNYVGMLMVDFTHNNPIMRVFCYFLLKTTAEKHDQESNANTTVQNFAYDSLAAQSSQRPYQGHSKPRNKWLVAYTLMKNPSIIGTRKHVLPGIHLIEASNARTDIIDRVQRSIASTLFVYIGMIVVLMTIAFLYFGIKAIIPI
ncbi:hypothetical protein CHS0354_011059 [Potamilus streckersoni]|uniref:Uncharacterized protein n=1 Tax=Potamilus streckersoni TaxID=2493646 RepID=A0AAE0TLC1_9BIVA|nr:hypothetical protein CHS0354_011059 [Potamilus streckersoni]